MKSKGGRPNSNNKKLLARRNIIIESLLKEGYKKAEVAFMFNLHKAQITRLKDKFLK